MTYPVKSPRKLIEVALPLDVINVACAREKSIRHGHPSALHLWWARRPLAAARAVIFAQLVNDPGYQRGRGFKYGRNKKEAATERQRLFKILEDLVQWENTNNPDVIASARAEVVRSWREVCALNKDHPDAAQLFNPDALPALHDPFVGGGSIPLEAQRLGLQAYGSDLNPVAVLISKATIEIPSRFRGRAPVGREVSGDKPKTRARAQLPLEGTWSGTRGLAEDVRRYGAWMLSEARRRIGHLYPQIEITRAMAQERVDLAPLVGERLTPIAWIWARTVTSPSPAFSGVHVPLVSSFVLSSKKGKEAYVEPIVSKGKYEFSVRYVGNESFTAEGFKKAEKGTKAGKAQDFLCLLSGSPISRADMRESGKSQTLGVTLMAIVAEGPKGRVYLAPQPDHQQVALSCERDPLVSAARESFLSGKTPTRAMITGGVCSAYGLETWGHLFSGRQLVALTTFSELVAEARQRILADARRAGMTGDDRSLEGGGSGPVAYADGVATFLGFLVGQLANHSSTLCGWNHPNTQMRSVFSRQAISMTFDFAEANVFSESSGSYTNLFERQVEGLQALDVSGWGCALQANAQRQDISAGKFISTDPPYYDNISYAILSDFFYAWMRRSLGAVYPSILSTIAVPKAEELIASPFRQGSKEKAEQFFLDGMTEVMHSLAVRSHPEAPITIYYALKQSETSDAGTSSPGWETFLGAVFRAGFCVVGTWPMRTEKEGRAVQNGVNALASCIVLVCRRRSEDAPSISRRQFLRELNEVLPEALDEMTRGTGGDHSPVAPVDLSQAIIGPGIAVFSKYSSVLEADGSPMTVHTALQLINRFLAEDDFDADTQFCLQWFQQNGWREGKYGDADTLSRAKGTSVSGLEAAGVAVTGKNSLRLLSWSEYPAAWDPVTDPRIPVWEVLHHLVRTLKAGGEAEAGRILALIRTKAEAARQLAYRLYTVCERQGVADDARIYNEIITSWSGIEAAAGTASTEPVQGKLFD